MIAKRPPGGLSDSAKSVIWHIFGAATDPRNDKSARELAGPVLEQRIGASEAAAATEEILSWFESHDGHHWLAQHCLEPVAQMILDGVDLNEDTTRAVWAIAAIDDQVITLLLNEWPRERIGMFCDAAIDELAAFGRTDDVVDAGRMFGIPGLTRRNSKVPLDAIQRSTPLGTFAHIDRHRWKLVHHALHPSAGNLVDIVVTVCPEQFTRVVEELEHPVLQARAADALRFPSEGVCQTATTWITPTASDALIAIAVIRTLHQINDLRIGEDEVANVNEVNRLAIALVDRIGSLPAVRAAGWFGNLLHHAPRVLHRAPDGEHPPNVQRLEEACLHRLAELTADSTTGDLVAGFRDTFAAEPSVTALRHVAELAWVLREGSPEEARTVARRTLDDYRGHVDAGMADRRFYFSWQNWQDRGTVASLGRTLALTADPGAFLAWVEAHCRRLPLSVWDAEERYGAFLTANRVAQHTFLVALHALEPAMQIGHAPTPEAVRTLTETIWAHCRFADTSRLLNAAIDPTAGMAARAALLLGKATETWILDQVALDPGPRALLQIAKDRLRYTDGANPLRGDAFVAEFTRACAALLDSRPTPDLHALAYWGELWLTLDAPIPAERTGIAILHRLKRVGRVDRPNEVRLVELLTLSRSAHNLAPEIEREVNARYDALWSTHTPASEYADREQVDRYRARPHLRQT